MSLNDKGIDLGSILCPRCGEVSEDVDHALVNCPDVKRLWIRVGQWWNKSVVGYTSVSELLSEDKEVLNKTKGKSRWVGTKWAFLYYIWGNRNRLVFGDEKKQVSDRFFEWQRSSFEWTSRRSKAGSMDWASWTAGGCG